MTSAWAGPLLRLLRVPADPRLPAGEPASARVFRASHRFWLLRLLGWGIQETATLIGFVTLMLTLHAAPAVATMRVKGERRPVPLSGLLAAVRSFETVAWALWLVQLPLTLAILRLDYELRWYIVTDRAVRLREGILGLTEMTFTLANVQDIRIQQGPLQRLLGIADLELRTAGGGDSGASHGAEGAGTTRNLHLARFRGVDDAAAIRDLLIDRMKKVRGAGLGDPDEAPVAEPAEAGDSGRTAGDLAVAARELLDESTRLRLAASRLG